jgi:hypothetical protein
MPEATVDENDGFARREDQVRIARQALSVKPEPVTETVN